MSQLAVYGGAVGITALIQGLGFLVAFALQTEVFYDILGGLNFLSITLWSATSSSLDTRKAWATCLFLCSRGWLLVFLAWRAHERKGDSRFDELKGKFFSFMKAWIVQGMWVMLISMPVLFINSSAASVPMDSFDWLMACGFGGCILVEILADVQKAQWVKRGRPGGFCQEGLWAVSRHPNYFGEIFQWWFAWLLAFRSSELQSGLWDPLWWACSISPLFTMLILLHVKATGVCNAEGRNLKRYYDQCPEDYAKYRDSTSVLIPMVGYQHVPLSLKRTIFLDFEKYEYKPKTAGSEKTE
ncbi:unnamed protein product [Effrenium voratum]|uniref:Steroid 5-alpha reductase C-terminal domain-containing protein n=1 Tax=Effrenium voratum TaxID=2562239 RepID=A0AA36HJF3_9DINO|nr:unnamed protein product [Effrenium voratum]CAJ1433104.1 unnamed protein product [Effrenium voratum]